MDPLENRLRIRLTEALPARASEMLSAKVASMFSDGAITPDVPSADEQKRVAELNPGGGGHLRNFRVFTVNFHKLLPVLGKTAMALAKGKTDPDPSPVELVMSAAELLLEVFRESSEPLTKLDADLLFALYPIDKAKPVTKSTKALAAEQKLPEEEVESRLQHLEKLAAVRYHENQWELIETVKIKF